MVKRIVCRVVRSVPFERVGDVSRSRRRGVDRKFDSVQAGFNSPSNSSGYTFGPDAIRAPFGESAAGLLLDCLA